jgi:hypothetical protein
MNEADQVAVRVRELSHFIDGQRSGAGSSGGPRAAGKRS